MCIGFLSLQSVECVLFFVLSGDKSRSKESSEAVRSRGRAGDSSGGSSSSGSSSGSRRRERSKERKSGHEGASSSPSGSSSSRKDDKGTCLCTVCRVFPP